MRYVLWRYQERTSSSAGIMRLRKIQRSSVHCLPPARHRKSIRESGWTMSSPDFHTIRKRTPVKTSGNCFRMSGSWRSPTKIQLKSNRDTIEQQTLPVNFILVDKKSLLFFTNLQCVLYRMLTHHRLFSLSFIRYRDSRFQSLRSDVFEIRRHSLWLDSNGRGPNGSRSQTFAKQDEGTIAFSNPRLLHLEFIMENRFLSWLWKRDYFPHNAHHNLFIMPIMSCLWWALLTPHNAYYQIILSVCKRKTDGE